MTRPDLDALQHFTEMGVVCVPRIGDLITYCRKLEAENKRLREGNSSALGCLDDPTGGTHVDDMRAAASALRKSLEAQL